jgi:zinc protease
MKKIFFAFFLAPLLALAPAVHAQQLQAVRTMEGVTEYRLANGLQVLLAPNDLQPRTYANLVVKAGSAVEGFGEGGMAHLLEHLVFKGTPTTKDAMKAFEDRSLNFNGTTSSDRTNYFASMNPDRENLHWYLGWLADASTNSFISKADLDKEMTVVRNEFERAGSSPDRAVWEARLALAFPNHGYGRPTIGNRSDIENVNIERLQAFYKTWYRPDNMVLVVSGRFDATTALAHIQSVFGVLKNPSTSIPKIYTREPVQDGVRESVIRRAGTEVITLMGWRGSPRAHRDDAVLDVIANALANKGGGRFKTEVEKLGLGSQVSVGHGSQLQYGTFDTGLRVKDASKLDEVQSLLLKHIADIAKSGVTAEELAQAQTSAVSSHEESKRNAEGFGASLAESAAGGDWRLGFWYQDNMRTVTIADTIRAAKDYLVDANRVRVSFVPENNPVRAADPLVVPLANYIAKPVVNPNAANFAPLERFEPTIAEIDKHAVRSVLKSGARLVLLPRPAVGDAIQGTLRIHWGNLQSMRGLGASPYLGGLLMKGTTTRSERQIKDELDKLQSKLSVGTGTDGMTVGFTTTRQNWAAFAVLMQDVIRNPAFKDEDFRVWQQEAIAGITKQLDSPEAKTGNALNRAMSAPYAATDPRYVPTLDEQKARWQALKLSDVTAYWQSFSGADANGQITAEFGAAGAMDVQDVQKSMALMLDDWKSTDGKLSGAAGYQRIPRPLFAHTAQSVLVATPDKPNAMIYAAHSFAGDPWSKEGIAMTVANAIIGGSASSRLFSKVRKEEGLSYGVWSYLTPNEDDKVLSFGWGGIFAPTNRTKFESTVAELFADIRAQGLSSIELFVAKRVAADRVKQGLASDSYISGELARAEYKARMGEPRNAAWYEEKHKTLQDLTIEDLDAAAKKLADFSRLVQVTAGEFN